MLYLLCLAIQAAASDGAIDILEKDSTKWSAAPTWLQNAAATYQVASEEGLRFAVSESGRGMKWVVQLATPADMEQHGYLTLRYRAEDLAALGEYAVYFASDATGRAASEAMPVRLSDLFCDGSEHLLSMPAPRLRAVTMAVQVQAAGPNAYFEILELSLRDAPLLREASSLAEPDAAAPAGFETYALAGDGRLADWLPALGYSPDWFAGDRAVISGVPFAVGAVDHPLPATPMAGHGEITVDAGAADGDIYLLLGAQFTGDEAASIGSGPIRSIRQVERFVVRLDYADGPVDYVFPVHMPSKRHTVVQDLAAYAVQRTRNAPVQRVTLIDGTDRGAFLLAAISAGPRVWRDESAADAPPPRPAADAPRSHGTPSIAIDCDPATGSLAALTNRASGTEWLAAPCTLYTLKGGDGIDAELDVEPLGNGEIALRLTLTNASETERSVQPTFPALHGLTPGGDSSRLGVCYPALGPVIGCFESLSLRSPYGGPFPLQFMGAWYAGAGGVYLMTRDTELTPRHYVLEKGDAVNMGVEYWEKTLAPGERWVLPEAVIGAHGGDWHGALTAYREWLQTWYTPAAPRKAWFREVFNFRQLFLYVAPERLRGAFDRKTKTYELQRIIDEDTRTFGGVDYLHIFDWGYPEGQSSMAEYNDYDWLGGLDAFRNQVRMVQNAGVPVGLYIQGLFIGAETDLGRQRAQGWQIRKADGEPLIIFNGLMTMCPFVEPWRAHLSAVYARVAREVGPNGMYVDSIGFGDFVCHDPDHGHPVPTPSLAGETLHLRGIREATPPDIAIYSEELSSDVSTQYKDGAFTYAINHSRDDLNASGLNLARFALPDAKTFEILVCDLPFRDDIQGVKRIFFNGEGMWVDGTMPEWIAPEMAAQIKRNHAVLRQYRRAFTTDNPVPHVKTRHADLYANEFPAADVTVWTLYNAAFHTLRGELFDVAHVEGADYYDAWNEHPVEYRVENGRAALSLEIGPRDVGCIVQRRGGAG